MVDALRGHDALIVTMSNAAPVAQHEKLFEAAADADIPWVLPNEWSVDSTDPLLVRDVPTFYKFCQAREKIVSLKSSSYIAVHTGFWYEWSLAIPAAFGFDFANRHVTLIDEGKAKISMTTWAHIGNAVTALLSLPVTVPEGDGQMCLEWLHNRHVYIASFTISQLDIFESVLRVTGTRLKDWSVGYEPAEERYRRGTDMLEHGDRMGSLLRMYARVFYPDGCGNFETKKDLCNAVLGLDEEDLDTATRHALRTAGHLQMCSVTAQEHDGNLS